MSDIFISYSPSDLDSVAVIGQALEAEGFGVSWRRPVALDRLGYLSTQINEAKAAIVVWSAESAASKYVSQEAEEGRRRGVLIPVLIEPTEPPLPFRPIRTADLSSWGGDTNHPEWSLLIEALDRLIAVGPHGPRADEVSDIFISYSPSDLDSVAVIGQALEAEGFDVSWRCQTTARSSEYLSTHIEKAKLVIVVWSGESAASKYVSQEAEKGRRRGVLIPVLIEPITPPSPFHHLRAADLTDWGGDTNHPEWSLLIQTLDRLTEIPLPSPGLEPD